MGRRVTRLADHVLPTDFVIKCHSVSKYLSLSIRCDTRGVFPMSIYPSVLSMSHWAMHPADLL